MKVLALLMLVSAVLSAPSPQGNVAGTQNVHTPYEFAYEVADPATNNFQNRAEIKLPNGDIFGSYSHLRPDNFIQTVSYNYTQPKGFQYSITLTPTGQQFVA